MLEFESPQFSTLFLCISYKYYALQTDKMTPINSQPETVTLKIELPYAMQGGPPLRLQRADPDAPVLPGAARRAVGGGGGDVAPLRQRYGAGAAAALPPPRGGAQRPPPQACRRPLKVNKWGSSNLEH